MSHASSRKTLAVLALASLGAMACDSMGGKGDPELQKAVDSTAMVSGDSAPAMSEGNIFAMLDMANVSDSTGGAMAATKGTHADIKAFGRMMVKDHHALRQQGMDLAKTLNVTPEPAQDDSLNASSDSAHAALAKAAKGKAWDRAYIDHTVMHHQMVLNRARAARTLTQNAELQALLDKAVPSVQAHLDRAEEIQREMGGGIVAKADSAAAKP